MSNNITDAKVSNTISNNVTDIQSISEDVSNNTWKSVPDKDGNIMTYTIIKHNENSQVDNTSELNINMPSTSQSTSLDIKNIPNIIRRKHVNRVVEYPVANNKDIPTDPTMKAIRPSIPEPSNSNNYCYMCPLCKNYYASKLHLKLHVNSSYVPQLYNDFDDFWNNNNMYLVENNKKCHSCDTFITSKLRVTYNAIKQYSILCTCINHIKNNPNNNITIVKKITIFYCKFCNLDILGEQEFLNHQIIKHASSTRCKICLKLCGTTTQLLNHRCIDLVCKICKINFAAESSLTIHNNIYHKQVVCIPRLNNTRPNIILPNHNQVKCIKCDTILSNDVEILKKHMKNYHPETYAYKCGLCWNVFDLALNINAHLCMKSDFVCTICGFSFDDSIALKHHNRKNHLLQFNVQHYQQGIQKNVKYLPIQDLNQFTTRTEQNLDQVEMVNEVLNQDNMHPLTDHQSKEDLNQVTQENVVQFTDNSTPIKEIVVECENWIEIKEEMITKCLYL
jgi:hypothetical protein